MTTGVGPYVVPDPSDSDLSTTVLETVIYADETPGVDIGGGLTANAETYNGTIPGPTLRLNVGDTVIVRLINLLKYPTGIHWHGIELANSADGTEVTQEPVLPAFASPPPFPAPAGGTYLYKFKVPRPGIYWYHPHHHFSTNRVFRGLYGMIVVADPNEAALIASGVIPAAADTKQLVLSDITVCKAVNDTETYVDPTTVMPASDAAEWLGGATAQVGPAPISLCQTSPIDDAGSAGGPAFAAGDIPNIQLATQVAGVPTTEGQTVLTNGMNVGGRAGTPLAPQALAAGAHMLDVRPGQGLRLQIVNCATIRYFRLILTTSTGAQLNLVRIGGEGGLLDNAIVEGNVQPVPAGTFDTKYTFGELLLPPASRADVVVAIPDDLPLGSVLTLWTRDISRTGAGFSNIPTVPVMHLRVMGAVVAPPYTIGAGTALRASIPGAAVEVLGAATTSLLDPATFMPAKDGIPNEEIRLTVTPPGINGTAGHFEGFVPYTSAPNINSSRYAEQGHRLQLTVRNTSQAHHPFHLHGFSFQPISLTRAGFPTFNWSYREFRDNIDIPAGYTLTFIVRLDDRELVDGVTLGGALGRWLFHCHIFFHHHQGMISELVVTAADGSEKPNVDVGGSWAYTPSGGIATRRGTFQSPDGIPVGLSATVGNVIATGANTWEWTYDTTGVPDGVQYVYITATDSEGRKDQTVFRLKIGAPDDGADNGDPHIRTVDGKYYDFQAVGEFTLLRDTEGLEIQVRQTPVPTATPITDSYSGLTTCVSVNTAVAARIGDRRISYQPADNGGGRLQFFLDGKPTELTERGIDLEAGRVVAYPVGGTTALRVDYANYTVLTVTPYFWSSYNIWILNMSVTRTDADQGIMGRVPSQTWLPMLPNGATVGPKPAGLSERYIALYRTFANAWRVTDATSLFVYAPGTSTKTFTDVDWPTEKPPCKKIKPQFQVPGANPPLVNIKLETAERICKPVKPDDLHRGCVFDVATTGDKDLVRSYLLAQEVRRKSAAVQIVANKSRTRPGEGIVFTATVSAGARGRATPSGRITFLIDDVAVEKPMELNELGRAYLKTEGLSAGLRRIRAVYTPGEEDGFLACSSPSLRHLVERKAAADRTRAPYWLGGLFYEACDCFTVCPCWLGNNPDEGECTGVFAWEIEKGSIDGVDVTGLRTVSVSHHAGIREEARQRVVIFVDERATQQQADALAAAFSGRLGGPLQELTDIMGELLAVERAPIEIKRDGRLTTLTVDRRIRVEGRTNEGPSGRPMELNDGLLSKVLGTPAEVGESGRFRVGLAEHGMKMDLRGRSTMSGRFSYAHAPKANTPVPGGHGS